MKKKATPFRMSSEFAKMDGHRIRRASLISGPWPNKDVEYNEDKTDRLIGMAFKGDVDAHATLCYFASRFLLLGEAVPQRLAVYVAARVLLKIFSSKPRRIRGADPYAKAARDSLIIEAINIYRNKFGWHATRSEATTKVSACAQVAIDFGMKERAVEEVWSNRGRFGHD